jgi:hypothetical protein
MGIDPTVAAMLLALAFAGLVALVESGKASLAKRRARAFCASCGRKVMEGLRTCGCDL